MPLDLKLEAEKLRQMYRDTPYTRLLHAFIMSLKGGGKTTLGLTCPRPIFYHIFDPGGSEIIDEALTLKPGETAYYKDVNQTFKYGEILASVLPVDTPDKPSAFLQWQKEFNQLGTDGFFSHVGTYIVDTASTMGQSMLWQILKKEGRTLPNMRTPISQEGGNKGHGMRQVDWGTLLNTFIMVSRSLAALPCHTILFGHIGKDKDPVTGITEKTVLLPGQSKDQVPINLHEVYALRIGSVKLPGDKAAKNQRYLLTQPKDLFATSTRMGRDGRLDAEEVPNIRALLKKAGYPYEDKPPLV